MASNKVSKQNLVSYIQEQVTNLYKLQVLKEQREKINKDLKILGEGKKKSEYSEKAKEFISNKMEKMADEDKPQAQKVAIAMNMARKKGMKVPKEKINEGFSEKGIATIQKWIEELGARSAAVKLIDTILKKMVGLSSSDLADTATFSNGLDEIEDALNDEDYDGALEAAKETAREMLEDEGFGDMMNESILSEEVKVDRDTLMSMLKKNYPKAWFKPGEGFGSDYSENTIWTGEGSYANDGMKLFDPYSDDYENYELEVYKPFNDFVESMGYYVEPYDTGTFFILPG